MIPDALMQPMLRGWLRLRALRPDRGDVPGWVLITVMSALLMIAILGVAEDRLKEMLDKAFTDVENAEP